MIHLDSKSLRALVVFAVVTATTGFASAQPPLPSPPPGTAPEAADYKMGSGDVLHIVVYENPDLTLDARVSDSGVISYPLLGAIKVGGLTISTAERMIASGLVKGEYVRNPQVTIVLAQVRGNQVSVLGQVNHPGRYPLEQTSTRLSDVVALAGGVLTPVGSDTVTLVGTRNGQPFRKEVDLPMLFSTAARDMDLQVQNNDVVFVDRAPVAYIYGEVQHAGPFRLERHMTVMQALASGGGLTQRGTERGVRVHRRNPSTGKIEVIQPSLDDTLVDGDVVFVRESLF